jgi:hypothetical protein
MNTPQNPYRSPSAAVADMDRPRGSPVKGVIYGVLVDIIGTTVATVIIMMLYGVYLGATGGAREEIERAASQFDLTSPIGIFVTFVGYVFSFVGGYVCARVARRSELKWAAVVAAISAAFGLVMGMQMLSLSMNALFAALAVATVMAGGYAGARRNAKPF